MNETNYSHKESSQQHLAMIANSSLNSMVMTVCPTETVENNAEGGRRENHNPPTANNADNAQSEARRVSNSHSDNNYSRFRDEEHVD